MKLNRLPRTHKSPLLLFLGALKKFFFCFDKASLRGENMATLFKTQAHESIVLTSDRVHRILKLNLSTLFGAEYL